jgi:hypothetical protein
MLNELLEHDNRRQDSKALTLRKQNKHGNNGSGNRDTSNHRSGSRNDSANPGHRKGKNGRDHRNDRSDSKPHKERKSCEGCKGYHLTENCYYLHEDKRPEGWEVYESKQHLLAENRTDGLGKKPAEAKKVKKVLISGHVNKAKTSDDKDDTFWMDSAADIHITHDFSLFDKATYKEKRHEFVAVGDGSQYRIHGVGTISIDPLVDGDYEELDLVNVHYVPNMEYNLLSLGTLERNGCKFQAADGRMDILNIQGELCLSGTRIGTGYSLDSRKSLTALKARANPLLPPPTVASPLVKSGSWT